MSFDTPGDPRSRNTALARLLAEALQSRSKTADHAESSACPDAELLAAYADHGLAEEETVRWESHFADCDRCQKVIAILAASGEQLTPAEVEKLGSLAAASVPSEPVLRSEVAPWIAIWRRPVLWRWLVPAAGLASAALWFALRQTPPRETLTAQKIETRSEAPQSDTGHAGAAADSSAKSDETQIAQTNLPATPAAPPSGVQLRDKETAQTKSVDAARESAARKQKSAQNAAEAPPVSELDRLESREESAKDDRVPSAQAANKKSQTDTFAGTAAPASAPAPAAPSAEPPAPAEPRAARQGFGAQIASSANEVKQLAKAAPVPTVFSSPRRTALWRVGPGGRIEYSANQGRSWQPQTSGVTADLLAGAAPTQKIAWVVGRAGVILRTEDGEHWQGVTPPPAPPIAASNPAPDWIGVEARDALHATITSRDLRRFATEDGGRTWAPVK